VEKSRKGKTTWNQGSYSIAARTLLGQKIGQANLAQEKKRHQRSGVDLIQKNELLRKVNSLRAE